MTSLVENQEAYTLQCFPFWAATADVYSLLQHTGSLATDVHVHNSSPTMVELQGATKNAVLASPRFQPDAHDPCRPAVAAQHEHI